MLLAIAVGAAAPPSALSAITLLSEDTSGNAAGGAGLNQDLGTSKDFSPDGRFVLFTSTATDLVAGVNDTNGQEDGFVRDLETGTTRIVSVDADGNALGTFGTNTFVGGFVFSPDSSRLLFRTQAANVIGGLADTNNAPDWFIFDLFTGTISCVTISSTGGSTCNSNSFTNQPPVFSPDGKLLAFISQCGDLVDDLADTTGGGRDLYVRNFETNTTSLISETTAAARTRNNTDDPAQFSPDGRNLAYLNLAPDLVSDVTDTNNFTDLFVRDLQTDTTVLVTRNPDATAAGFQAAGQSFSYGWAPDGHAIVFGSQSETLVDGVIDTNNFNDVFLWDTNTEDITIVSVDPLGTAAGADKSHAFGFSPDSRYVAFQSASANLTADSDGDVKEDLYVRDTENDTTVLVAHNETGSVVFEPPIFLGDGVHMLFKSAETDVVAGVADTNGTSDLFRYNLQTHAKDVVTVRFDGTATANTQGTSHDDIVVSPNGRYVSFVSDADDLVEDFTTTSTRDLFVRDLEAGVTSLVTVYINGGGAGYDQGATRDAEFSRDNRFLLFTDNALLASPVSTPFNFNFANNLYSFDVVTNTQYMLSTNAAANAPANGGVEPFSFLLNPAGGSVAFLSTATDMVDGINKSNTSYDLFAATLPAAVVPACGDPVPDPAMTLAAPGGSRLVKASDALYILRVAVGSGTCELCVCDVDGSGAITASDALATLKLAVGQPFTLDCPAC